MTAKDEARARYDAANTRQVKMKLNLKTDADILEVLDAEENKQAFIKRLIRAEITRRGDSMGTKS